jgi:hypothetical protein
MDLPIRLVDGAISHFWLLALPESAPELEKYLVLSEA